MRRVTRIESLDKQTLQIKLLGKARRRIVVQSGVCLTLLVRPKISHFLGLPLALLPLLLILLTLSFGLRILVSWLINSLILSWRILIIHIRFALTPLVVIEQIHRFLSVGHLLFSMNAVVIILSQFLGLVVAIGLDTADLMFPLSVQPLVLDVVQGLVIEIAQVFLLHRVSFFLQPFNVSFSEELIVEHRIDRFGILSHERRLLLHGILVLFKVFLFEVTVSLGVLPLLLNLSSTLREV
jgi:hypothetical protein